MPQRPRSHQLESESKLAFGQALPPHFHFREASTPEYGIDGEVEVFDPDTNEATGLRFNVQLKATDEDDLKKALKRRLPIKTFAYYRAQATPVLMVRYVAAHKAFYVRWAHEFDPYYEHRGDTHQTFHWSEENLWNEETAERLVTDVRQFHAVQAARLDLPIKLALAVPAEGAHGLSPTELRLALQSAITAMGGVFRLSGEDEPDLRLELDDEELRAHLSSLYSLTLHFESDYAAGEGGEHAARDMLAAVAYLLARAGHATLASRSAVQYLPASALSGLPDVAATIASAIAYADRIDDAIKLATALDADESDDVAVSGFLILLGALSRGPELSASDRDRLREALEARIERRIEEGSEKAAAGEAVGLAHVHSADQDHEAALAAYERALELDPDYEERAYYWEERGGAAFLAGHSSDAAEAYAKALALGSDDESLEVCHADALLHSGRYRSAFERLELIEPADVRRSADVYVKQRGLGFVLHETGIEEQEREIDAAQVAAGQLGPGLKRRELRQLRGEIVAHDAVSPLGWFNLARSLLDRGKVEQAKHAYLVTAIMQEGDVEAWVNVAILSIQTNDNSLFPAAAITGHRLNPDRYQAEFARQLRTQIDDSAERERILGEISELIESVGPLPERRPFRVRLNHPGEETEIIELEGLQEGPHRYGYGPLPFAAVPADTLASGRALRGSSRAVVPRSRSSIELMERQVPQLDAQARAREKQRAREAAERALRSGGDAARQAKDRNEAFAAVAEIARPNLAVARSLS